MNKKIWIAALLVTVMAVAAGCGSKPTAAPNQTQGAGTETNVTEVEGETITEPVTAEPEENTTPSESTEGSSEETTTPPSGTSTETPATSEGNEKKTITVFYTDEEELELHKASAEISYASDDAKYKAAFESLQQSKDAKLVPLWAKEIELKSVQFKDGALTLDIHMPDTARLGAGGESYALDALKQTFFQFDEVKSLDLLVDGQQSESLMGHVDLEHPMTRSE
ncbi:GerMN domain-containing protein [Paenibacillus sp. SZ31]|uniref:GerMN domain-containing protein n=1 Tax=unclassified Paenibacillus TaxID=185978 RepID=UPI00146EC1DC|nr:GerMN domain-containing protein [Paenibacillus sp. SZ31]NMI07111.1 GerMN domain-containing protein [Paenibacillus sp. SZ31]